MISSDGEDLVGFPKLRGWWLVGCLPYRQNGEWVYPPFADAFEIVGIQPIDIYIESRWNRFQPKVEGRIIWDLCTQACRLPGTPTGTRFYWEQRLDAENPN